MKPGLMLWTWRVLLASCLASLMACGPKEEAAERLAAEDNALATPASSSTLPTRVLIDGATRGYYNAALGTALDGTQAQFPLANVAAGDPLINPAAEPNLSTVGSVLGDWLSPNPLPLNSNWSEPQTIPATWAVNTETAIIYEIDAGHTGLHDVVARFGIDNGLFVWLDGSYRFGALAPGGAQAWEYIIPLGDLLPGKHFLQVLREDHGVGTGYLVQVTGSLPVSIGIDIKPGSLPNSINLGSKGVVPVAILGSASFDASTVDPASVTLAGAPVKLRRDGSPLAALEDVNGDRLADLVVHVVTGQLQLSSGDTVAILRGETFDGTPISGVDSVRIVP